MTRKIVSSEETNFTTSLFQSTLSGQSTGLGKMCGIVGIYYKNKDLSKDLGTMLGSMLVQMSERGPDSAGVAVYRNPVGPSSTKLSLYASEDDFDWNRVRLQLVAEFNAEFKTEVRASHAVVSTTAPLRQLRAWLAVNCPELRIMSAGSTIEIYKEAGAPRDFVKRFKLQDFQGSHALGHTRMATESAITTQHSHPFSTGLDLCLVHNGSLSNHNRLREQLQAEGIEFQTDNDSEVAAGYLMWQLHQGATLEQALTSAISDLDGFYTFAVGTRDGFAVLRDPIACKPAVMAENDDWVAMASEFRAIAQLPGVEQATVWEPAPATVYSWGEG
jgi:glutamate synthase domain-containing protein 1